MKKRDKATVQVVILGLCAAVLMTFLAISVSIIAPSLPWIMGIVIVAVVSIFAYLFPTEIYTPTPQASRIAAIASAIAVCVAQVITQSPQRFGLAIFMLMTALIAGGFLFEMLREDRSELIRSLSNIIFMGTMGLVASGWMVTGSALADIAKHPRIAGTVLALIIVGVPTMCAYVAMWARDPYISPNTDTQAENTADAAEENLHPRVCSKTASWGYIAICALLSGVFPLIVVCASTIANSL
ncbi:hypothetical protein [Alloscardovia criceti]|uniref:hypothetical protein n=1 Tax=Alloscardovia criceti TaxID=356828 RepID=UPI0003679906|nr:hypothetical protein [Alloscardovia criceti]